MAEARRTHSGPGWKREAVVAALAGLLISSWSPVSAAEKERRKIPVTINKGETYVIADVSQKETAPGIKVAANPDALVVQNAPGKIVLVGADAGSWKLDVTLASGEKNMAARNRSPVTAGASPVRAPSATPAADSM